MQCLLLTATTPILSQFVRTRAGWNLYETLEPQILREHKKERNIFHETFAHTKMLRKIILIMVYEYVCVNFFVLPSFSSVFTAFLHCFCAFDKFSMKLEACKHAARLSSSSSVRVHFDCFDCFYLPCYMRLWSGVVKKKVLENTVGVVSFLFYNLE